MYYRIFFVLLAFFAQLARAEEVITVATFENRPFFYDHKGRVEGFFADSTRAAFAKARLPEPRLILVPFARLIDEMENNPNTCIPLIARTKEREHKFTWVAELIRIRYSILVRQDHPQNIADQNFMKSSHWVTIRGTAYEQSLNAVGAPTVAASTYDQMVLMVGSKRADGMVMDLPSALVTARRLNVPIKFIGHLGDFPGYFTCSRQFPPTQAKALRAAYKYLDESGALKAIYSQMDVDLDFEEIKSNGQPVLGPSFELTPNG